MHQVGETRLVFNLAPKKDNEAIIFTRRLNRDFTDALAYLFDFWQSELGVTSWNMVIFCPPIAIAKEEKAQWGHFPWMARIVDRGSEGSVVSDIGYKELYGLASIVSHDPFEISRAFARYLSSS
ncbi:hypothetical protein A2Z23_03140 [Candidatus Curtissbacteria bacterium RBG_16_39_7]|uniref:Uncharacterized protein n=1 Tax=Candidatus Curtissbacteria bacterium RBG_16_39_7 TaxID=1797707 RepID=A0A1F5G4G4_9BACT|nr:MAG: hypothetical protein A2Z23_03140 [Candidatus Curtissbacteria bacterium RBG_16_39_7]